MPINYMLPIIFISHSSPIKHELALRVTNGFRLPYGVTSNMVAGQKVWMYPEPPFPTEAYTHNIHALIIMIMRSKQVCAAYI